MHDQHGGIVIVIETRPFVGIERVGKEVARHVGVREHPFELGSRGFDEIDPAALGELWRFLEASVFPAVDGNHRCAAFLLGAKKVYQPSWLKNLTSFS